MSTVQVPFSSEYTFVCHVSFVCVLSCFFLFFFVFFFCVCRSALSVGVVVNVVVCMFTSSFLLEYQQHWQLSLNSATVHVCMYMYMYYTIPT